ncbi:CheR family methyltransferase [Kineosporia babensis]|uniref:protein-glutamate O-methyltransferase n=1 Tax=Kineosporia babensis TaxID=499548 RepID=A0A9X1NET9_9ACTN|nr:protein-glutamate O-methyltransferase CheR [Kineosporia babensis]
MNTPITSTDFSFVADLVRQRSAIDLQPGKEYLVESRLVPLMRVHGENELGGFVGRLRRGDQKLIDLVIDALTTNETLWFRDTAPFDVFSKQLLPDVARTSSTKRLTIWSAACSSGQEGYSLAMLLLDWLPKNPGYEAKVIGTDISRRMIERASAGKYSQLEINRGLRVPYLVKYFDQVGRDWVLKKEVRDLASFKWGNLAQAPVGHPQCDVIFLRNVLIYFDPPTKKKVIENCRSVLRPGGYLVLGGAETAPSLGPNWKRFDVDRAVVFQHLGGGS